MLPRNGPYQHTNESLPAIVHGLAPTSLDTVVAVLGSGDQAFALLERGCRVVGVDRNPEQIAFVERRIRALEDGRYGDFLGFDPNDLRVDLVGAERALLARNDYFSEDRLERIGKNLGRLTLKEGEVTATALDEEATHLYLSNALNINWLWAARIGRDDAIRELRQLSRGTTVYTAHYTAYDRDTFGLQYRGFAVDRTLTRRARALDLPKTRANGLVGYPTVYVKVAKGRG